MEKLNEMQENIDYNLTLCGNQMQIDLAESLNVSLEQFTEYFSEVFRKQFDRLIKQYDILKLSDNQYLGIKNQIKIHLVRHMFSGEINKLVYNTF